MNTRLTYEEAKDRVKKLKEFYQHLVVYVLVNFGLIILNLITGTWWFVFPLLGWGIGIAAHGLSVFAHRWGNNWQEEKIKELMEKGK
ncbi:2TM domain-containing protein [Paenibacillus sp.]|uniref:2TM domain-containing protein n=1 Tax=Paenibacillus sp. TaxID=58172 RepID=UPI002D43DC92|nr:2TM domain-containing protein [Paenibacillus sp.]HZG55370.1 2TM domain-containing protein [Paenibacillus sp.]